MSFDFDKATAELPILRDFIDFVNKQSGVYMDCLAGFEGHVVRITRQIPRVNRPTGREIRNGEPTIVWTAYEDPGAPDIIINTVHRVEEYLRTNSEAGFNESQIHAQMHRLFVFLKQGVGQIVAHYVGHLPGAPDMSKITGIAFQNAGPRKP